MVIRHAVNEKMKLRYGLVLSFALATIGTNASGTCPDTMCEHHHSAWPQLKPEDCSSYSEVPHTPTLTPDTVPSVRIRVVTTEYENCTPGAPTTTPTHTVSETRDESVSATVTAGLAAQAAATMAGSIKGVVQAGVTTTVTAEVGFSATHSGTSQFTITSSKNLNIPACQKAYVYYDADKKESPFTWERRVTADWGPIASCVQTGTAGEGLGWLGTGYHGVNYMPCTGGGCGG